MPSSDSDQALRGPIIVGPGEGRYYPVGPMTAVFKADGVETAHRYSVSEWTIEPRWDRSSIGTPTRIDDAPKESLSHPRRSGVALAKLTAGSVLRIEDLAALSRLLRHC